MKTSAKKSPEQVNRGEKNSVLTIYKEELLYKIPAVVLVMKLPAMASQPMQLIYANRGLLLHTGFDPEALKASNTDICGSLLFPDDQYIMKKAVEHLLQSPRKEIRGLVFRIHDADGNLLWVICNCRVLLSGNGIPDIVISIWEVYDEKNFPKEALRSCLKGFDRLDYQIKLENLTKRETEVLACIGKGLSLKETAKMLFISLFTVETYIKNMQSKLQLLSIHALTVFAISAGLY